MSSKVHHRRTNVEELKTTSTVLMDGTFEYCCQFFKQLFTIFIVKNGHYVPVLFCLLPNKTEATYECLFKKIRIMIGNDSLAEIMVDFEIAIHNALNKTWPRADIFGCRFHLTQSWFRKVQNLGLATVYRSPDINNVEEQEASKWLHRIFGLPFLSPEDVGTCFVEDFMTSIPQGQKFARYADYLVENYIEEESKFPPKMWASFTKNHVTTNPCESFHSRFKKKLLPCSP
ncbi:uncharacterized protein LOC129005056 [Macrosteles quadrilineatus]|uniref:uncharacterized protein LOC129005056 n=1 Tax=Macrosteles quadrilineatus TaxID=74068 RepID=UPI0023E12CEA|nr:uncharacterized protein LOC129005056 [Macrosteles quadrilineatus]